MRGGRAGLLQPWELAYVGQYESYNIVIHIFCYYTAICVLRIYIAYYVGVVLLVLEYAKNTSITIHKPYSASVYRRRHTSLYVVILSREPSRYSFPGGVSRSYGPECRRARRRVPRLSMPSTLAECIDRKNNRDHILLHLIT